MMNTVPKAFPCEADRLNHACVAQMFDRTALRLALSEVSTDMPSWLDERPHLFSDCEVFVSAGNLVRMSEFVAAVERVVELPAWRQWVSRRTPGLVDHPVAARGAFLGYDFHLGPDGPRLIEINTNAGGGLLNTYLLGAYTGNGRRTGEVKPGSLAHPDPEGIRSDILAMFREEWRLSRGERPLRTVAIVDENPSAQYLAPEFELFKGLFAREGFDVSVIDPGELHWDGQVLSCQGRVVDLIYNRLTDFQLASPASASLRAAWQGDAVVLTPHPLAHALYADKRNLCWLSDEQALLDLGVAGADRALLLGIVPRTVLVTDGEAGRFWQERRQWFFKPAAGFGSRAAYRGDKLTRRVFEEILQGEYIAQHIVPPPTRRIAGPEGFRELKWDLRCYAYAGRLQLAAARLYDGQTTNFRTPGGGFAPVTVVPGN